ncbi:hypothetical protein H0I54_19685 [Yersinia kristensenii]|uniref:hypothetical protein n=1 Tax=Yersinia kristensenii TaxID=28152 RepID=UPI001C60C1C3|nr:hypothetical protein [Yersinia kristensenii]MBW5818339.1 hypothetical protein [Yersinia kristensenii]MBW5844024.1 hypothetical protein [Yersinia kristensenii]
MKFKYIFIFIGLLTANIAVANNKCTDIQAIAKTETINGQSNIPKEPFVVANKRKVYFYTAPDNLCKQGDKFVIAGDFLYAYKIHGDFTYVNYITAKGEEVKGWVNSTELNYLSSIINKTRKKNLNIIDFTVINQNDWFGLGVLFSNNKILLKENIMSSEYIGDFPNDNGGLNKFYSHVYKDFIVISSNVNYNERLWTMDDDYIISTITLTTPKYHTGRNVKVGDNKSNIINSYSGIEFNESSNMISYSLDGMSLIFNLANDKITSIQMSLISELQ